jgi:hypothetical protein
MIGGPALRPPGESYQLPPEPQDDEARRHVKSQGEISIAAAAGALWESRRFWPAVIFVAVLTVVGLLIRSGPGWDLLGVAAAALVSGYGLSVSRSVFDRGPALPPLGEWTPMVRRALSVGLVVLVLLLLPWAALVLAVAAVWPDRPQVLIALLTAVLFTPPTVIATSQYIAFDRLRDGFRYRQAWRRFRLHPSAGLRVVGYLLLGELLWVVVYAALSLLGPARNGAEVVFGVLYAPILLLVAHLQGQYVAVAYVRERSGDSVQQARQPDTVTVSVVTWSRSPRRLCAVR